nr:dihydrodipicolinate synthase family protein [Microbacterium fandaimingii]
MRIGLSAFPLTPFHEDAVDETSFERLVSRLARSGVDSIGALGSTGSYAYLTREERSRLGRVAVEAAEGTPIIIGIGATRTANVLAHLHDAQDAGASAVLLPALSYQPLRDADVFALFEEVTRDLDVPLIVYDNPGTTHTTFTAELYSRIAELPHVAAIKIPGVPAHLHDAAAHIANLRHQLPEQTAIGVSGDAFAAVGLAAGCDGWYSVVAGTLPRTAQRIMEPARRGDTEAARAASDCLSPLWKLFASHGSFRVVAAVAEELGLVGPQCLPHPIVGLSNAERLTVRAVVDNLNLRDIEV